MYILRNFSFDNWNTQYVSLYQVTISMDTQCYCYIRSSAEKLASHTFLKSTAEKSKLLANKAHK